MSRFYMRASNGVHNERTMRGFSSRGLSVQLMGMGPAVNMRVYVDAVGSSRMDLHIGEAKAMSLSERELEEVCQGRPLWHILRGHENGQE